VDIAVEAALEHEYPAVLNAQENAIKAAKHEAGAAQEPEATFNADVAITDSTTYDPTDNSG
jgi:hypothetical protein